MGSWLGGMGDKMVTPYACKKCGTYLHNNESKCPTCNSTDIQGISRVTGYLSLDERFGPGKYHEREDRISHTEGHKNHY